MYILKKNILLETPRIGLHKNKAKRLNANLKQNRKELKPD